MVVLSQNPLAFFPSMSHKFKRKIISAAVAVASSSAISAEAMEDGSSIGFQEPLVLIGTRSTIQNSIDLKRLSVATVDGLSADEIGAIPALSIGEALETITGVAAHRDNGGATEISVRGLGPYLGTTVVNGRVATNGAGNRAVNFSIFPAEMFNKITVHKTQAAEYIEGAVSGLIHLDNKDPLDYAKRNLQVSLQGAYSPDEANTEGGQALGSRVTGTYIDQFDVGRAGSVGVSLAAQFRDETNPEQEYTTSTGAGRFEACRLSSFDINALPYEPVAGQRCDDENSGVANSQIQAIIDADPNDSINSVNDIPFAYIARDHRFRLNQTGDERQAVFGALQWQPNSRADVVFDFQYSKRDQQELRHDLQFSTTQEDISALTSNPTNGIVFASTSDTPIYTFTTDFQRLEEYNGLGLNAEFQIIDELLVSFDASYSDTLRTETDIEIRLGATEDNTFVSDSADFTTDLQLNTDYGVALATVNTTSDFTPVDASYFNAADRVRLRGRETVRENTISAVRGDFELSPGPGSGIIDVIKGGVRFSTLEYFSRGGNRESAGENLFEYDQLADNDTDRDAVLTQALACANGDFPNSNFLDGERSGDLITINDGSTSTAFNEYATFDFNCLGSTLLSNTIGLQLDDSITSATDDVTENTLAFYLQADFEGLVAGKEIRGNFGVRSVTTSVDSVGYIEQVAVQETDAGFIVTNAGTGFVEQTAESSYFEVLPSATLLVDLTDSLILRTSAFKALSRPDPSAYGNGRSLNTNDATNPYSNLGAAINGISTTDNPHLKPLTSTNYDLGLEWYANQDTLLAAGLYYKSFLGKYENVAEEDSFFYAGQQITGLVSTVQTTTEESQIFGLELTATHAFDYLPGFLGGFGAKFSYNFADSDLEFEDGFGGDGTSVTVTEEGEVVRTELIGIIPPAELFGLSKHVSSTQVYWQNDKLNVSAILKTRSKYFQQFTGDTDNRIRYTDGSETLDLRMSYDFSDYMTLTLAGTNLTNEPRRDFRAIDGNVHQIFSYGPRFFGELKIKI